MERPKIDWTKINWEEISKNIREDTWEPYQEEVIPHEVLDLPRSEEVEEDTGPLYSVDDPIQHAVRRIPFV